MDVCAYSLCILERSKDTPYIGEEVSQLEHALQCAYFACSSGHSNEVIIASLFHDIGHWVSKAPVTEMDTLGVMHHERIGAEHLLEIGFSSMIADLVGSHVNAKRYLASHNPNYLKKLSNASLGTLSFQGGPMSNEEMIEFEKKEYFQEKIQVRINDERAKVVGLKVPDLQSYGDIIRKHLAVNATAISV